MVYIVLLLFVPFSSSADVDVDVDAVVVDVDVDNDQPQSQSQPQSELVVDDVVVERVLIRIWAQHQSVQSFVPVVLAAEAVVEDCSTGRDCYSVYLLESYHTTALPYHYHYHNHNHNHCHYYYWAVCVLVSFLPPPVPQRF